MALGLSFHYRSTGVRAVAGFGMLGQTAGLINSRPGRVPESTSTADFAAGWISACAACASHGRRWWYIQPATARSEAPRHAIVVTPQPAETAGGQSAAGLYQRRASAGRGIAGRDLAAGLPDPIGRRRARRVRLPCGCPT